MKRTPLKRKTRLKARRTKPRRGLVRDAAYKRRIRGLPCILSGVENAGHCRGRVDPHHLGEVGETKMAGYQASDHTVVPCCRGHHDDDHGHRGYFADRDDAWRERYRRWALAKAAAMLAEKDAGARAADLDSAARAGRARARRSLNPEAFAREALPPTTEGEYLDEKGR